MTYTLRIRPEARDELQEIYDYYEQARPGLGDRFLDSIELAFRAISENPHQWRERLPGIRRKYISSFPYSAYYAVNEDLISVLCILHHKRDHGWIEKRLRP